MHALPLIDAKGDEEIDSATVLFWKCKYTGNKVKWIDKQLERNLSLDALKN